MASSWQIQIFENREQVFSERLEADLLELGRQREGEEGPYTLKMESGRQRLVIARLDEPAVSRQHVLIKMLPNQRVQLTNRSSGLSIPLTGGREIVPGATAEAPLPFHLALGNKTIRLQRLDPADEASLQCLAEATMPPGQGAFPPADLKTLALSAVTGVEIERLLRWLQSTMDVIHSAAGSSDFFVKAARAVVDMVNLDSGQVILLEREVLNQTASSIVEPRWKTVANYCAGADTGNSIPPPSQQILAKVQKERRTFWQALGLTGLSGESLTGIKAVVAAPILDRNGTVIGILYGDRWAQGLAASGLFTKLEATLVELLASGVAAGLARVEQEQKVVESRVRFEQFFTPELARQLASSEDVLSGRDVEVSVLFCDIRNYSRISERLGPAETVNWLRSVLNSLSECVLTEGGVLVDYIGDELMAMWGAPMEQPDHATRACRAALAMLGRLPRMNERWEPIIQEPLRLGIGINTGVARVGNVGSKHKFKYGPLGNTVNMASRVQGATKYLKTNLLVTEATFRQLSNDIPSRRVCKVAVINIAEAVYLHELAVCLTDWDDLKARYEEALADFEAREFRRSARTLGNLLANHRDDGPSIVLLARAVNHMVDDPDPFNPVWELPGK